MYLIKKPQTNKFIASKATAIFEYLMPNKKLSGAIAKIKGCYPETGVAQNLKCYEMVYVIKGQGFIKLNNRKFKISTGDTILILPEEIYQWVGKLTIYMVCTPKFTSEQHKIIT